ncbi:MAG TPA: SusF/SusE family outer membrane protein [Chitinophagaceae bacterium]|nr:SusF/SusE family outer membrane protein [Chitinophagaceae bacterium]
MQTIHHNCINFPTLSINKKRIKNIYAFFICAILFWACKKTEDFSAYNLNVPLKATATDSTVVLNESNKNNTATTFNWTSGTNHGTGSSISYTLQIDKKGNHFASALKNNLGTATYTSAYTVDALNTILLNYFGASPNTAIQLEARIVDSISGAAVKGDTSNVISLTFTPYQPVSKTLYIIGDATSTGWNANTAAALALDATTPGLFTYQGILNPGHFKFITTPGSFIPSYNMGTDSLHVVLRNSFTDPDKQFTIYNTNVYNVSINIITLQINITTVAAPLYSKLWIVGDATPNGWNINSPNQMKVDVFNPFIFRYNEVLNAGEFKIPTSTGNWGGDFYRPLTNHPAVSVTTAALVPGSTNPQDNKWQITNPGAYKIALNIMNNTININPFTPYPALWIVGDATPNGWNINSPTPMVAAIGDPNTFIYIGPLTAGEFKIPTATGDWGCSYFRPEMNHPPITDTNAPYVAHTAAPADTNDYKWYISTAGNYKITFNQLYETITIVKQ